MEEKENLIDALIKHNVWYMVLVSLFSADTLIDTKSCYQSLDCIAILRKELKSSKHKDDPEVSNWLDKAEKIVLQDLHKFEKGTTKNPSSE